MSTFGAPLLGAEGALNRRFPYFIKWLFNKYRNMGLLLYIHEHRRQ